MQTMASSTSLAVYSPFVSFKRLERDLGRQVIERSSPVAPVRKSEADEKTGSRQASAQAEVKRSEGYQLGEYVDVRV